MEWSEIALKIYVRSYIAEPYWPELSDVVDIQKKSGVNRVRSEDKRDAALKAYLQRVNMTVQDYEALVAKSRRPWYRQTEPDGPIIIPRHHLSGCLVQACVSAPAGARIKKESLRSIVQIGDLLTDRVKCDTVFARYVRPMDGSGKALSNQRTLRRSEVIEDFDAVGVVQIDLSAVEPDQLKDLLSYAGKFIGVGASRKMGYGRFDVLEFGDAGKTN
jgi:hypothetical protein